jgi:hypothetical protein
LIFWEKAFELNPLLGQVLPGPEGRRIIFPENNCTVHKIAVYL